MVGIIFALTISSSADWIANETIRAQARIVLRQKVDYMELSGRVLTVEKYRGNVRLYSHPRVVKDKRRITSLLTALSHSSRSKNRRLEPLDQDAPTDQIFIYYSDHGKAKSFRLFFDDGALVDDWGPEVAREFRKYEQRRVTGR